MASRCGHRRQASRSSGRSSLPLADDERAVGWADVWGARITAALHFLGLLYILLGGFLAWRWPRAIFPHLPFALWGLLVVAEVHPTHPLTWLEDRFREAQGLGALPGGFNEYYIYGTLIPRPLLPVAAVVAISIVLVSYAGAYLRWKSARSRDT